MTVVWSSRAVDHLENLRTYIENDNPGAAARVAARILTSVDMLQRFPMAGRKGRILGTRELPVSGTPFLITYRISEENSEVNIDLLAIFHGHRKWPSRL